MTMITSGEFSLTKEFGTTRVYRNGQLLGHFWEDPTSGGYAVFRHGHSKPCARPKTERTCVRKLTGDEWDRQAPPENGEAASE